VLQNLPPQVANGHRAALPRLCRCLTGVCLSGADTLGAFATAAAESAFWAPALARCPAALLPPAPGPPTSCAARPIDRPPELPDGGAGAAGSGPVGRAAGGDAGSVHPHLRADLALGCAAEALGLSICLDGGVGAAAEPLAAAVVAWLASFVARPLATNDGSVRPRSAPAVVDPALACAVWCMHVSVSEGHLCPREQVKCKTLCQGLCSGIGVVCLAENRSDAKLCVRDSVVASVWSIRQGSDGATAAALRCIAYCCGCASRDVGMRSRVSAPDVIDAVFREAGAEAVRLEPSNEKVRSTVIGREPEHAGFLLVHDTGEP
jgi:hypothetical protein